MLLIVHFREFIYIYSILYSVLSIIHCENSVSDLSEDQWASETEDCQSVGYACQVVLGVTDI